MLRLKCQQGHGFTVDESFAGKQVKCPSCQALVLIPNLAIQGSNKAATGFTTASTVGQSSTQTGNTANASLLRHFSVLNIAIFSGTGFVLGCLLAIPLALAFRKTSPVSTENKRVEEDAQLAASRADDAETKATPFQSARIEDKSSAKKVEQPVIADNTDDGSSSPKQKGPPQLGMAVNREKLDLHLFPQAIQGFAYDPIEGRIATIDDQNGLLLYSVDEVMAKKLVATQRPLKEKPSAVCLKRTSLESYFVVAYADQPLLQLFNTKTLELSSEINLEGMTGADKMHSSENKEDPFLYLLDSGQTSRYGGKFLWRYDLRNKVLNKTSAWVSTFGINRKGDEIYLDGNAALIEPYLTSTTLGVYKWQDEEPTGRSAPPITTDLGRGFGIRKNYFAANQLQTINPCFAFKNKPLLLGWQGQHVWLFTTEFDPALPQQKLPNQSDIVGEGSNEIRGLDVYAMPQLPPERFIPPNEVPQTRRDAFQNVIVGDEKRGIFIAVQSERLGIGHIPELVVKDGDPCEFVRHDMPSTVYVGRTVEIDFEIPPDTAVSIVSSQRPVKAGDKGINPLPSDNFGKYINLIEGDPPILVDGKLKWTPSTNEIGAIEFKFRSVRKGLQREWSWVTEVAMPSKSLGFHATAMDCRLDGKTAVVWGSVDPAPLADSAVNASVENSGSKGVIAVYDLPSFNLRQKIELPHHVHSVTFDDQHLIVCHSWSEKGQKVERDAKIARVDIQTGETVAEIESPVFVKMLIAGDTVMASEAQSASQLNGLDLVRERTQAFDRTTFRVIPLPTEIDKSMIANRVGSNIMRNGILWDSNMQSPLLLGQVIAQFRTQTFLSPFSTGHIEVCMNHAVLCKWQANFNPAKPIKLVGSRISSPHFPNFFSCGSGVLQVTNPGAIARRQSPVKFSSNADNTSNETGTEAPDALNLIQFERISPQRTGHVALTPDHIYLVYRGRLYRFNAKQIVGQAPLQFEPKQSTFLLPTKKSVKLKYSAPGATAYELHLFYNNSDLKGMPNVSLESKSGEFKVALEEVDSLRDYVFKVASAKERKASDEALQNWAMKVKEFIKPIIKTKIQGIPVPVKALVVAHNETQTAMMIHEFVVDVPLAFLNSKE